MPIYFKALPLKVKPSFSGSSGSALDLVNQNLHFSKLLTVQPSPVRVKNSILLRRKDWIFLSLTRFKTILTDNREAAVTYREGIEFEVLNNAWAGH